VALIDPSGAVGSWGIARPADRRHEFGIAKTAWVGEAGWAWSKATLRVLRHFEIGDVATARALAILQIMARDVVFGLKPKLLDKYVEDPLCDVTFCHFSWHSLESKDLALRGNDPP
jgi:hypothetical protein